MMTRLAELRMQQLRRERRPHPLPTYVAALSVPARGARRVRRSVAPGPLRSLAWLVWSLRRPAVERPA
jgi:hypothetical protein